MDKMAPTVNCRGSVLEECKNKLFQSCEKWRTRVHKDEELSKLTSSLPHRLSAPIKDQISGIQQQSMVNNNCNSNTDNNIIDITKGLDHFYGCPKILQMSTDRENNSLLLSSPSSIPLLSNDIVQFDEMFVDTPKLKVPYRARASPRRHGHQRTTDKQRLESSLSRKEELSKLIKFSPPQIMNQEDDEYEGEESSKGIDFGNEEIIINSRNNNNSGNNININTDNNDSNNENSCKIDMDNSTIAASAKKGLQSKLDYSKVQLNRIEYKRVYPEVMLVRIKGEKHVDVRLVAPKVTSLHHFAVFVLIKPDRLILFNGKHANLMEKSRGMQFVNNIISKNGDLGCKAKRFEEIRCDSLLLSNEDVGINEMNDFWKILGVDEYISGNIGGSDNATDNNKEGDNEGEKKLLLCDLIEKNGDDLINFINDNAKFHDEPFEKIISSTINIVFKIDEKSMMPEIVSLNKMADYRLLQPDANLIFDFGSEIYVWYGRNANRNGTRQAVIYAKELFDEHVTHIKNARTLFGDYFEMERPKWCSLVKLSQGLSDILFENKFYNWKKIGYNNNSSLSSSIIISSAKHKRHINNIYAININNNSNQLNDEQLSYALGCKLAENKPKESILLVDGDEIERFATNVFTEGLKIWVLNNEFGGGTEISNELIELWPRSSSINDNNINNCCVFYENMCYIIKWDFRIERKNVHKLDGTKRNVKTGRSRRVYFFWLGLQTTKKQQGLCALALRNIDKKRYQHERIMQNDEPYAFMQLFNGNLIIRGYCSNNNNNNTLANSNDKDIISKGENNNTVINSITSDDDIGIFVIIGSTKPEEYRLIELNTNNSNSKGKRKCAIFRSHAVYVILSSRTNEIFVWYGRESLLLWRKAALNVVSIIVGRSKNSNNISKVEDIIVNDDNAGQEASNSNCDFNNYGFSLNLNNSEEETKIIELEQNDRRKVISSLKNSRLNFEYFDESSDDVDSSSCGSADQNDGGSNNAVNDGYDNCSCDIGIEVISAKNWKQPPRLIRLFENEGDYVPCQQWDSQMPFTFHQYHLRDTVLVDQGTILWVWSERVVSTHSLRVAKSYWQVLHGSGPIYVICKGYEPIEFKALFYEWRDFEGLNNADVGGDKNGNDNTGEEEEEVKFEMCELNELLAERTKYFTIDQLKRRDLPSGIDLKHLEGYLNDDDFLSVFDMDRTQFYHLPAWKQIQLRKQNHLF